MAVIVLLARNWPQHSGEQLPPRPLFGDEFDESSGNSGSEV